jgi:ABC-type dipeptide/oligopeptide/nickel transport system permease component
MLSLFARRLLGAIPVLLALVLVVFLLQKIAPLDPVTALVGRNAPPDVYEAARHTLGLDQPIYQQFWNYVTQAVQGNLGESTVTRTQVSDDIAKFLPVTLELIVMATLMMIVLGFFLGLATAQRWPGSGILRFVMIAGSSVPVFLTGLFGILLFYRWLHILPVSGQTSYQDAPTGPTGFLAIDSLVAGRPDVFFDDLKHLVLPALCVAITPSVQLGRVLRSSLEQALRADSTRTARAKGLGEKRILFKHVLRNSLGPSLALMGLNIAGMAAAAIIVEVIFSRPGIGLFVSQAITAGDFNAIAGVTLVIGVLYVVVNLIADLLQAVADPRVAA